MTRLAYRPEIDGLRAIAVISVVLFHAGLPGFGGGFVGVDVFFVISGYLITSIIQQDLAHRNFSLIDFYERRARRILPALVVVLAACVPIAWLCMPPSPLREFGSSLVFTGAFASNLFFYQHADYFGGSMEVKPLAHTWSLAIEEQFYLLFPLVLMLLAGQSNRRRLSCMLAAAFASLAVSQTAIAGDAAGAFYLLPSRAWELLVGAMLAMREGASALRNWAKGPVRPTARRCGALAAIVGLLLVTATVFGYDSKTSFPGVAALAPTLGAALLIVSSGPGNHVGRLLASRPLVAVGLISYSTYLWHQPLLAFARHLSFGVAPNAATAVAVGLSFALGHLSWRYIERPFRTPGTLPTKRAIPALVTASLAVMLAGTVLDRTDGFESHYLSHRASESARRLHSLRERDAIESQPFGMQDDGRCRIAVARIDSDFSTRFAACARLHGRATVVFGDSHAVNVYNALYESRYSEFMVGMAYGGCRFSGDGNSCSAHRSFEFLKAQRESIEHAIYHQSGSYFIADPRGKVDSDEAFISPRSFEVRQADIAVAAAQLDQLAASDVATIWLGPYVEARIDLDNLAQHHHGDTINPVADLAFRSVDANIRSVTGRAPRIWTYVSMYDLVPMEESFLVRGDCLMFRDRDHLSRCGERWVGGQLAPKLRALLAGQGRSAS